MKIRSVSEIKNLKNVNVLLRLDLNVPVQKGKVIDDYRIKRALPTIDGLLNLGSRIIIISHIEGEDSDTLLPVADHLKMMGYKVNFVQNYRQALPIIKSTKNDEIVMLENLRINEGEKMNDTAFAKELASLGDVYINDAFSVSHRKHASVSGITEFIPSYAGPLFEKEVLEIGKAFNPERPFLFILGGAKFETKIPLIEKFLEIADMVFIGGALANDLFKARGLEVGKSKVSDGNIDSLILKFANHPKIILPIDVIVRNKNGNEIKDHKKVDKEDIIMDVGPKTIEDLDKKIKSSKQILWNGPLGAYELGYKDPTIELARMIEIATKNGAKTILGGGDTLATIKDLGLDTENQKSYTFVSTGGGAMLDYLANGTLPGIESLKVVSD